MQTLQNGIEVPTNSDTYALTLHLANMGNKSNVVIPVANKAARDALANPYAGMTVSRLDLPGCPLETHNGTKWPISDVPWTDIPMAQGFNPVLSDEWAGLKYSVKSGVVIINGAVQRATSWSAGITCGIMPAELAPPIKIQGTNNAYIAQRNVSLGAGSVAVSLWISYPLF